MIFKDFSPVFLENMKTVLILTQVRLVDNFEYWLSFFSKSTGSKNIASLRMNENKNKTSDIVSFTIMMKFVSLLKIHKWSDFEYFRNMYYLLTQHWELVLHLVSLLMSIKVKLLNKFICDAETTVVIKLQKLNIQVIYKLCAQRLTKNSFKWRTLEIYCKQLSH